MVEYSFDIPVVAEELELDFPATMEKIDLDISVIPENTEHEGGNTIWNSAGKTGGANGRSKSLPNYLSSPSGSCHDICKYGARIGRGKSGKRDRLTSAEGEDFMQNETVAEKKKKSTSCLKPSADPETQLLDKLPVMREIWLLAKNAVASSQQISSPGKQNSGLKRRTIRTKPSLLTMPGFLNNKRNSGTKITKFSGSRPASQLRSPRSRSNYGIGSLLGNPRSGRHTGSGSPLGSPAGGRNTVIESPIGNPRSGRNTGMRSLLGSPRNGRNTEIGSPLGSPRSGRNAEIRSPLEIPRSGRNTGITSLIGSPKSRRNSLVSCSLGSPRTRRNSLIGCSLESPRSRRNSLIGCSLESPRSRRNSLISTSLGSPRSRRNSLISSSLGSPRGGRNTGIRFSLESPRSGGNSGIRPSLEGPKSGRNIGIKSLLGGPRSGENTGIGSGKDRETLVTGETRVAAAPSTTRRLSNIKTGNCSNVKGLCHLKNQSNPRKTGSEHPSTENIPEKILHVIESKAANKTMGATPNSRNAAISPPPFEARSLTLARRGIRVTHLASSPEKKNQRQAQTGVHTSRSPPSVSPLSMSKSLKHTREVLRRESSVSSSGSLSPLSSLSESMLSDESGTLSGRSSTETDNPSDIEYERRPRRVGKISPGDEDDSPCKLNSGRGLQHENNCPRKLRSKKGTCLCKTNSGGRRSIKRAEAVHIDFADELERVVLAHVYVEDNDDNQTCLSDNIEEVELKHLDVEDEKDNKSCIDTVVEEAELRPHDAEGENEKQSFLTNMIEEAVLRHHDVEDRKGNQSLLATMIEEVVLKHHDVENEKHNQSFLANMIEEVVLRHRGAEDEKDNHSFLATMIEGVVLRHHDVEDKRGNQNLFNNMIEETASKLVQDRKSKVKALVGAFESVISLQDTTSMAPTRAN